MHLFASVLVIYSVRAEKLKYFLYSLVFKSPIDAIIPWFNQYIGASTLTGIYTIEAVVVVFGLVGLYGTKSLKKAFQEIKESK